MFIVRLLRWLFGYVSFTVEGSFPERFLNMASRRGINLWKLKGTAESLSASARETDYRLLTDISTKTGHSLSGVSHHGVPHLFKSYKHRCGLLAGFLFCVLGCHFLSGFIWQIRITVPDLMNEYEVRRILKEHGVYEGVRADSIDVGNIINSISLTDTRISWMTLNLVGTTAEVNISPSLTRGDKQPAVLSNLKSASDGVVTRVQVYKGTAHVNVGDGISKNQLLVSGIMEYNNGNLVLSDANARIYAATNRRVEIHIPKQYTYFTKDTELTKQDLNAFGLTIPLSLTENPPREYALSRYRQQCTILGQPIPLYINCENWFRLKKKPMKIELSQAEKILKNKLSVYEFFMVSSIRDGSVINKTIAFKEEKNSYTLLADFVLEENVCVRSVVKTDADQS